jgi:hypothetical protein
VAVQSIFNPVGTLLPLAAGKGTELVVSAAGYGELAPEFGNLVGTLSGLGMGGVGKSESHDWVVYRGINHGDGSQGPRCQ